MSEFEELRQLTANNKNFIDFNNDEDIKNMGKQLRITETTHSYGKVLPTLYYDNGIALFDKFLNGAKEYEYQFTFHIVNYVNAIMFVLFHAEKGIMKFGIWRQRLIKFEFFDNQTVEVVRENRVTNLIASGIFARGPIQLIASITAGAILQKAKGIKTTLNQGTVYKLYYFDENDTENFLEIHTSKEFATEALMSLLIFFPENKAISTKYGKGCYIATSCYGGIDAVEVEKFRQFRDTVLSKNKTGRFLISVYYLISPYFVSHLDKNKKLNHFVKVNILDAILRVIDK